MKTGWLLYDEGDYRENRMFASHIRKKAEALNLSLEVILTHHLKDAHASPPDFVISRQRNPRLSAEIESLGIPVFNNSRVCDICNDKRKTHRFLQGLPLMRTMFPEPGIPFIPMASEFPLVVKPAFGHGGDRVQRVQNQAEIDSALAAIYPNPALVQEEASEAGRDLRVYILFGEIVAAVMRTAVGGIVSNYKRGGSVNLHTLTGVERELAEAVVRRFTAAKAPLSFAGIDLIRHLGRPVVNEVEDVVGSRMLYQVSDLDIIALYIERIAGRLSA